MFFCEILTCHRWAHLTRRVQSFTLHRHSQLLGLCMAVVSYIVTSSQRSGCGCGMVAQLTRCCFSILLNSDMVIKVTDFGSAKILDQSDADINDERSKSFVGTAEYVSPELLRDRSVGKECDFWALGCIIYQMITGKPPFKATNEYLTFQLIMKLDYVFPDNFPPVARDLVEKLLVLDPEDRLGSGEDGIEDIRNHEWFKDVNFQQIWSMDPPSIATGMNEPSPQSNIPSDAYFELGWEESDEDESEQIKDEQEEQQQQLRDEEDNKQTDEKTTSSPGFSSDSDYLAPLTLSSIVNDGKEMSDELKSQL